MEKIGRVTVTEDRAREFVAHLSHDDLPPEPPSPREHGRHKPERDPFSQGFLVGYLTACVTIATAIIIRMMVRK